MAHTCTHTHTPARTLNAHKQLAAQFRRNKTTKYCCLEFVNYVVEIFLHVHTPSTALQIARSSVVEMQYICLSQFMAEPIAVHLHQYKAIRLIRMMMPLSILPLPVNFHLFFAPKIHQHKCVIHQMKNHHKSNI